MKHKTVPIKPALTARDLGLETEAPAPTPRAATTGPAGPGRNVIYFGPPGVGKSHAVEQETTGSGVTRTVFHPEVDYGQFVGTYRPVVGREPGTQITGVEGRLIDRPVSYFAFVPGPFVTALVEARSNPSRAHALIIEEINRGDCAAIFGDVFQLLDRQPDGSSQYGIDPSLALADYLRANGVLDADGKLRLPANLSILATMNTSDQSLYPMDAAFKRRWEWRAIQLMAGADKLTNITVGLNLDGRMALWTAFVEALNETILAATGNNEDKQVGPWYVRADPATHAIRDEDVRYKLLFYLWHDVLRDQHDALFRKDIATFDQLQAAYESGGLLAVLNAGVAARLGAANEDAAEATDDASAPDVSADEG